LGSVSSGGWWGDGIATTSESGGGASPSFPTNQALSDYLVLLEEDTELAHGRDEDFLWRHESPSSGLPEITSLKRLLSSHQNLQKSCGIASTGEYCTLRLVRRPQREARFENQYWARSRGPVLTSQGVSSYSTPAQFNG